MACGLFRCRGKRGCICPRAPIPKPAATFSASCADEPEAAPSDVIALFQRFDIDGNGKLDRSELAQMLRELDSKYWTARRIMGIFRAADLNHDRVIDWNEFLNWIFAHGAEQRTMREVVAPALESAEANKQLIKSEHMRLLWAAESAASLAAALKNAEPFFRDDELWTFEEQLQQKCTAEVLSADTMASLMAALDLAGPSLGVEEKERQEQRLKMMQCPFKVCVSTISGEVCEVEVTRQQTVCSLGQRVAKQLGKKMCSVRLAHSEGCLEPHTALLEECGVTSSSVMIFATFGEADPLQMQLTLAEYLDEVLKHGLMMPDKIAQLQLDCKSGKMSEIECREKFRHELLNRKADEASRRNSFEKWTFGALKREALKWNACMSDDDRRDILIDCLISIHKSVDILKDVRDRRQQYVRAKKHKSTTRDSIERDYRLKCIELKYVGSHTAEVKEVIEENVRHQLRKEASILVQKISEMEESIAVATHGPKAEADKSEERSEALEMARIALDGLEKRDLSQIKANPTPPQPVMIVCVCVCILRPLKSCDDSIGWSGAKVMLSDNGLKKAMQDYDVDGMKEKQIKQIRFLLNRERETFQGDGMQKISNGAYILLQWILAMVKYFDANGHRRLTAELQDKLRDAQQELELLREELNLIEIKH